MAFPWRLFVAACLASTSVALAWTTTPSTTTSSLSSSSVAWKPLAPPRFDVFAETLVGKEWTASGTAGDNNDGDDNNVVKTNISVEEVMRSCGGAVQGFQEVIQCSSNNDDASDERTIHYMNRANDEFLFEDSGSYTCRIASSNDDPSTVLTNLPLPPTKQRMLVKSTTHKDDSLINHQAWLLGLKSAISEGTSPLLTMNSEQVFPFFSSNDDREGSSTDTTAVQWNKHTRCRMPSPSMPWMAQRLAWEQCRLVLDSSAAADLLDEEGHSTCIPWSGKISVDIGSKLPLNEIGNTVLPSTVFVNLSPTTSSYISYVAAYCHTTHQILCVSRQYNAAEQDKLCSIVWSEGKVFAER